MIRSESDLPSPLVDGTLYVFVGLVDVANKIIPPTNGRVSLTADTIFGGINYTGSGSLFENTSLGSGIIERFRMTIKTPTGTVNNIEGGSNGFVVDGYIFFVDCNSMGTVKGTAFTIFFSSLNDCGQGIIADSNNGFTFGRTFVQNGKNQANTKFITVQGTHSDIQIASNFFRTNGVNESVLNIVQTETSNLGAVFGNVLNLTAGGNNFFTGSKNQTAVGWSYSNNSGNPGIPDSTVTAQSFFTGPATTTIIAQNAWMIANLSGVTGNGAERISVGADGVLRYLGLRQDRVVLNGTTNMESAGVNKDLESQYVVIAPTDTSCTFTNGTNTINAVDHGKENGDVITFKNSLGTLPVELQKNVFYYVVNKATDTLQVSYTPGGAAVAFTDDGSGSNSFESAEFIGEAGKGTSSAGAPVDFKPTANSCALETNSEIVLAVRTTSTPVSNIVIKTSYERLNKI